MGDDGVEVRQRFASWRANLTATKERVRERFRVSSVPQRFLRQSQRLQPGGRWRATATSLVVARVFNGNIVLARVARSLAKDQWQKRIRKLSELFPTFRTLAAVATTGSVAFSETAQAEALAFLPSAYDYPGSASNRDQEISITLKRHRSGQNAMILAPESITKEDAGLFRDDSAFLKVMQAVAIPLIGNACHVFMHGLNSTEVYGAEKMQHAVFQRSPNQPLITVSNHTAAVDDPFVISSVLQPHKLLNASNLRWTLCATEKCFATRATSAFFRSVKVLPLTKGHGVFQEGMEVALTKLNRGEWVHIFPEGSRSRDGTLQLFKRGVGRLVLDANNLPLVVPFMHSGMDDVMPIGQKYFSTGRKVTILVGDPIYVDDLVKKNLEEGLSKAVLYDAIALRIESTMWRMKKELDEIVARSESCQEDVYKKVQMAEKVQGIWQYADWEAQGFLADHFNSTKAEAPSNLKDQDCQVLGSSSCTRSLESSTNRSTGKDGELCFTDISNGTLSRIQAHMDPLMFMGFAARGLLTSKAKLDGGLEGLCQRYWRRMADLDDTTLDRIALYSC